MDFEKANVVLLKKIHTQMCYIRNLESTVEMLDNRIKSYESKERLQRIDQLEKMFRFT